MSSTFRIAAVQTAPVFLRREATVEKVCERIGQAAQEGARLVVFPEAFVPTYPLWVWHVPAGETKTLRALYADLLEEAVDGARARDRAVE